MEQKLGHLEVVETDMRYLETRTTRTLPCCVDICLSVITLQILFRPLYYCSPKLIALHGMRSANGRICLQ
jgi:hypothetical protein